MIIEQTTYKDGRKYKNIILYIYKEDGIIKTKHEFNNQIDLLLFLKELM